MISADKLCETFHIPLDEHGGYIWGKSGQKWTQAAQDAATRPQTDTITHLERGDNMVRKIYDQVFTDGTHYVKAAGLSTDVKPAAGLITGSHFVEVDTGKQFLFDEAAQAWHEAPAGYIVP